MKYSIKDFYSNQNPQVDLVTFTEELLNGKLYFLCSVCNFPKWYSYKNSISLAGYKWLSNDMMGKIKSQKLMLRLTCVIFHC